MWYIYAILVSMDTNSTPSAVISHPILHAESIDHLQEVVDSSGSHFFDPGTMRWFGTKNLSLHHDCIVVGEDRNAPNAPEWWVRYFCPSGNRLMGESVGPKFASGEEARDFAERVRVTGPELRAVTKPIVGYTVNNLLIGQEPDDTWTIWEIAPLADLDTGRVLHYGFTNLQNAVEGAANV